jgi:hypothetical protein
MPPFNFGQTFNQSLQSTLDRRQQRRAQEASRQLRLKRLQQQAEQAQARREQERQMAQNRRDFRRSMADRGTVEVNRGSVDYLSGEGTARLDADTVASLNSQQEQQDERTVGVPRSEVGLPGEGTVQMTPGQFAQLRATEMRQSQQRPTMTIDNPTGEGQVDVPIPDRVIAQAALRQMQDGQSFDLPNFGKGGTGGDATASGDQNTEQQDATVPSSGIAGSEVGQFFRETVPNSALGETYESAKMLGSMVADPFTADFTQEKQQRFQQVGSEASNQLRTALSPDTNPIERERAMKRGLTKTQKALAELKGFDGNEQAQRLRRQFSTLQQVASRMQSGDPMQKRLRQAGRRLLAQFEEAESIQDKTNILSEIRKLTKQMGSQ